MHHDHQPAASASAVDPVCGMTVDPTPRPPAREVGGNNVLLLLDPLRGNLRRRPGPLHVERCREVIADAAPRGWR